METAKLTYTLLLAYAYTYVTNTDGCGGRMHVGLLLNARHYAITHTTTNVIRHKHLLQ